MKRGYKIKGQKLEKKQDSNTRRELNLGSLPIKFLCGHRMLRVCITCPQARITPFLVSTLFLSFIHINLINNNTG